MKTLLWIALAALALFLLDRLGLWAERRGWIYYRHRSASPGTVGNALLEVQALLEPRQAQVLEARREVVSEEQEAAEPLPAAAAEL